MIELPTLYEHQAEHRDRTREALARHGRVILNAPTGYGKTRIVKWILGSSANREPNERQSGKSLFTVHRRGLVDNAIDSFAEEPALPHGTIMSRRDTAYGHRIQVASIDSLLSWFIENDAYRNDLTFDLIVFDEAHSHHSRFATFLKYHDTKRQELGLHPAYVIGPTATPQAKGLADVYKDIVAGPSTQCLIDNNYLVPFRYFRATQGKLEKLVKRGGEFTKGSEAKAMDGLAGDLVRDWKKFAEGIPTVGFFPRRSHAKDAAAELTAAGLRVDYIDKDTQDDERRLIFRRLNEHRIDYLCNVQIVDRGVDIPRIGCIQLCVAMASVVPYRQKIGRASRRHPDKTVAIIIDHGGNVERLGLFEDDPPWSLDITEKEPGEVGTRPTIECPKCCVATGTMILTDRGEVPIQDVRLSDRVWDGVEFCSHDGTYCNGIKKVIEWCGLTITPDHEVLTHDGWKEAKTAKDHGFRPVSGGIAGTPVRTIDDSNPYDPLSRVESGSRSGLFALWKEGVATFLQNIATDASWMRTLHGEIRGGLPGMACAKGQSAAVALSVSATRGLQNLWRPRGRISVFVDTPGGAMDCGQSWAATEQIVDNRPHRQQRALRSGKLAMGHGGNSNAKSGHGVAGKVSPDLPVLHVLRQQSITTPKKGHELGGDCRTVAVKVWDIRNVGRRNRYCANGIIISNCAIYRGGKCACGYEPTPTERRGQGLEFDGSELKEFKPAEQKKAKAKSAEQLMISALYKAGRSGKTWRQCCGHIFKSLCSKQGTPHRVPRIVTVAGRRYEMLRYGSDDSGQRVSFLYPFTMGGEHGGEYLVKEGAAIEAAPY